MTDARNVVISSSSKAQTHCITLTVITKSRTMADKADRTALSGIAVQHADDGFYRCGNFCRLLAHNVFLIYSPNGTYACGSRYGEFDGAGSVFAVERCKIVFIEWHFLFTCSYTFAIGCIV